MAFADLFPTARRAFGYIKRHGITGIGGIILAPPLLLAAYPVLFLYAKNWSYLSVYDLVSPLAWSVALSLALMSAVNLIVRDGHKTSIIVSLFLVVFFSYGHIYELAKTAGGRAVPHGVLLAVIFSIYAVCVVVIYSVARAREYFTRFIGAFTLILSVFVSVELVSAIASDVEEYMTELKNPPINITRQAGRNGGIGIHPDIYYIILDSYSSEKALKDYFGFDNSPFTMWLKKEGFVMPPKTWSNYCQTALSIPSSLNMDYIGKLMDISGKKESPDRSPLKRLMAMNAVSTFLKERGYTIVKFIFGYSITDAFAADYTDRPEGLLFLHEFTNHIANTTMLICFQDFIEGEGKVSVNARRVMAEVEGLPVAAVKFKSPKFVFAHILCPHPPFVFDENGPITKYIDWDMPDAGTPGFDAKKSDYKNGYLGQVKFINRHIKKAIARIISDSKTPPVIILQADHGSGMSYYFDLAKSNPADRFSILNAYYLPYGGKAVIYDSITPVNSFREVLNYYFGANLEILPDRNFFTSGDRPYKMTEITERLKEEAAKK